MVEIAFDFIHDPARRKWFKNIGTNFSLPAGTVDALQDVACTLYRESPELKSLLNGEGRSPVPLRGSLPDCGG